MHTPLALRPLTRADLPFADSLRSLVGWNQTLADWQRFLDVEPTGCFLAEWNGRPAGTATTTVYGPELAWIGMVLVHPDHRRQGIGHALLVQCLQYLQGRGVRCIKLDATALGKKVYDHLGFKDEWTLSRWTRSNTNPSPMVEDPRTRNWQPADEAMMEPLDTAAFGVSRRRILRAIAAQSLDTFVRESERGRIEAFGMLRNGSRALYLGPLAAASSDSGVPLAQALLARSQGRPAYWDIPDPNIAAVKLAQQAGFTFQRSLIRMYLGDNPTPGDPQKQFALAGPEVG